MTSPGEVLGESRLDPGDRPACGSSDGSRTPFRSAAVERSSKPVTSERSGGPGREKRERRRIRSDPVAVRGRTPGEMEDWNGSCTTPMPERAVGANDRPQPDPDPPAAEAGGRGRGRRGRWLRVAAFATDPAVTGAARSSTRRGRPGGARPGPGAPPAGKGSMLRPRGRPAGPDPVPEPPRPEGLDAPPAEDGPGRARAGAGTPGLGLEPHPLRTVLRGPEAGLGPSRARGAHRPRGRGVCRTRGAHRPRGRGVRRTCRACRRPCRTHRRGRQGPGRRGPTVPSATPPDPPDAACAECGHLAPCVAGPPQPAPPPDRPIPLPRTQPSRYRQSLLNPDPSRSPRAPARSAPVQFARPRPSRGAWFPCSRDWRASSQGSPSFAGVPLPRSGS